MPWRKATADASVSERLALAETMAAHGDCETARAIWVELDQAGVAQAQAEIGRCYVSGCGVARNAVLAERWLTLAAQAGDALGQSLLGDFHFNGEGGTANRAIAEEW
jgi:TPR repeat protein